MFDCFEQEPLEAVHKDEPGSAVAKGGVERRLQGGAGTVELEVSWRLMHRPDSQVAQVSQLEGQARAEKKSRLSKDSGPEQPLPSELWIPRPQSEGQVCVLRLEDTDAVGARRCKSEPVYTPDIELLLANL